MTVHQPRTAEQGLNDGPTEAVTDHKPEHAHDETSSKVEHSTNHNSKQTFNRSS